MVILRCLRSLNINWFKTYDTKCKCFHFSFFCDFVKKVICIFCILCLQLTNTLFQGIFGNFHLTTPYFYAENSILRPLSKFQKFDSIALYIVSFCSVHCTALSLFAGCFLLKYIVIIKSFNPLILLNSLAGMCHRGGAGCPPRFWQIRRRRRQRRRVALLHAPPDFQTLRHAW